jgi:predicted TIM-barrel fold metal-dependent hydrolase
MYLDFHTHFSSADPDLVQDFIKNCERLECRAAIFGGPRYGGRWCAVPNEEVFRVCAESGGWLIPMAEFSLWDAEPDLSEIRRLVDLGARGFKFILPYYGYDHDLYMPVYEELEKLGKPALFHTGLVSPAPEDAIFRRPMIDNMRPIRLDRVARSFPKLKIVAAHLGTAMYREECASLVVHHPNLYFDLAGGGAFWGVTAPQLAKLMTHDDWARSPDTRNYRKMVFGSDAKIGLTAPMEAAIQTCRSLLLRNFVPEEDIQDIMGGTAAAWLGLKD